MDFCIVELFTVVKKWCYERGELMGEFIAENFLKLFLSALTAIVGVLARQVVKLSIQYKANQRGTKVLLANEITKSHDFYMRLGWCSVEKKRVVLDMYEEYKTLGGNGILTKLINDILNLREYGEDKR